MRDADFTEFVAARSSALHRLALGLTGDRHAAQDLVQTALVKAYVSWSKVRTAEDPDAYVRRILVNAHTSSWRRHRVKELFAAHPPDRPAAVTSDRLEDRQPLLDALSRLGRRQRVVVVLRYVEDRSDAEIADLLGCSEGTVRSQASRALATLRELPELDTHRPEKRNP